MSRPSGIDRPAEPRGPGRTNEGTAPGERSGRPTDEAGFVGDGVPLDERAMVPGSLAAGMFGFPTAGLVVNVLAAGTPVEPGLVRA